MITALLISVFIAVAVSIFLAFSLTRPIRRLSSAAQKVTHGDYSVRIKTGKGDELDQLSHDFNTMAATLEENEEQRKRWVVITSYSIHYTKLYDVFEGRKTMTALKSETKEKPE